MTRKEIKEDKKKQPKVLFINSIGYARRKEQKEKCLEFLYYIEDMFDYKWETISKCIDELQKLDIREL